MTARPRTGVYPGSFNPPTTAHLAVSEAARSQRRLDVVVWSVSRVALAKEELTQPPLAARLEVLQRVASSRPWLQVQVTEAQLLADVAEGFDVVIMGADKWHQINEVRWYASETERDAALARLPDVAVAPRAGFEAPAEHALHVDDRHAETSSSAARAGHTDLILPEALSGPFGSDAFDFGHGVA
jgi:nicotinic acid mononucleotide adenylyltransferase